MLKVLVMRYKMQVIKEEESCKLREMTDTIRQTIEFKEKLLTGEKG